MAHRSSVPTILLAPVALMAAACGGGSNVDNASPRVSAVPQQSTTGSSAFSLDLDSYVSDREGAPLTYMVTSGGGAFAGSVYSNTFDTMGEYTVGFTVTDGMKTTESSFDVRVTSGNFVVVKEDNSGVLLFDSRTNASVRVAGAAPAPSLAAGLGDGRLVYQLGTPGAGMQLWVFDPLTRTNTRLGANATGDATFRARTSDDKLVYSTGAGNDQQLFFYNPVTGVARLLADDVLSTITVTVNTDDLVFYELNAAGQADVWCYDPTEDETFAVGTEPTDEQLQGALADGGVVFSRVGGGGEGDLFYYRVGTGLVEIGTDVSALATDDKTFNAAGTASQVVFTASDGVVTELYAWNPASGQTTAISAVIGSGAWDLFAALGAGNEVVWQRVVSAGEVDAYFYDLDSATTGTVRDAADISQVLGVSGDGTTAWAFVRPSGTTSNLIAVSLVASPATQTWAAGGAVSTSVGVLANGDVVGQRADGTALAGFDVSVGTWGTPIAGTGLAFAGDGVDAGDFVYSLTVAAQTDLSMFDASANGSVVVSDTAGNDVFQIRTADGTLLFTRVVTGNANADLFVWNAATATRLTQADAASLLHDHTVLGKYTGSN